MIRDLFHEIPDGAEVGRFPMAMINSKEMLAGASEQISTYMSAAKTNGDALTILASYYTRIEPRVMASPPAKGGRRSNSTAVSENLPFCVALARCTMCYHLSLARPTDADAKNYEQLLITALGLLGRHADRHPLMDIIIRQYIFGLDGPESQLHYTVLLPMNQYFVFSQICFTLASSSMVAADIVQEWHQQLYSFATSHCRATLVQYRSMRILLRCFPITSPEQRDQTVQELHQFLRSFAKNKRIPLELLLLSYEKLKAVVNMENIQLASKEDRALAVHCSELFLTFRSPIRKEYVERFLYPCLCTDDILGFFESRQVRQHMLHRLLLLCNPNTPTACPFYSCICAICARRLQHDVLGALQLMELMYLQMPQAAYVCASMSVDASMSSHRFAQILFRLMRGVGRVLTNTTARCAVGDGDFEVASAFQNSPAMVYNIFYSLREVVRRCSVTVSQRAMLMLTLLRGTESGPGAIPLTTIEALGRFCEDAFQTVDVPLDPQLLCAETAMVLHGLNIEDAIDSAVRYFSESTIVCGFCGAPNSTNMVCPVNGTQHLESLAESARVVATIAECAGTEVVQRKLISLIRQAPTKLSTHMLIYHIFKRSAQNKKIFWNVMEPHIRSILNLITTGHHHGVSDAAETSSQQSNRSRKRGGAARRSNSSTTGSSLLTSEEKVNILAFQIRMLCHAFSSSYMDKSGLSGKVHEVIQIMMKMEMSSTHEALALWHFSNVLLRAGDDIVELRPLADGMTLRDRQLNSLPQRNGQFLLELMNECHQFNSEMRKLTGAATSKLVQDFVMQSVNIVSALLGSWGMMQYSPTDPMSAISLTEWALPLKADSTFWKFIVQQLRDSPHSRTAFAASLAQSVGSRFRTDNPERAIVNPKGVEPVVPVFFAMCIESMKQSDLLTELMICILSSWLQHGSEHTPGRYLCLVFSIQQMISYCHIMEQESVKRGADPSQYTGATALPTYVLPDAHQLMGQQVDILNQLLPAIEADSNATFANLVKVVIRSIKYSSNQNSSLSGLSSDPSGGRSTLQVVQSSEIEASRQTLSTMEASMLNGSGNQEAAADDAAFDSPEDNDEEFPAPLPEDEEVFHRQHPREEEQEGAWRDDVLDDNNDFDQDFFGEDDIAQQDASATSMAKNTASSDQTAAMNTSGGMSIDQAVHLLNLSHETMQELRASDPSILEHSQGLFLPIETTQQSGSSDHVIEEADEFLGSTNMDSDRGQQQQNISTSEEEETVLQNESYNKHQHSTMSSSVRASSSSSVPLSSFQATSESSKSSSVYRRSNIEMGISRPPPHPHDVQPSSQIDRKRAPHDTPITIRETHEPVVETKDMAVQVDPYLPNLPTAETMDVFKKQSAQSALADVYNQQRAGGKRPFTPSQEALNAFFGQTRNTAVKEVKQMLPQPIYIMHPELRKQCASSALREVMTPASIMMPADPNSFQGRLMPSVIIQQPASVALEEVQRALPNPNSDANALSVHLPQLQALSQSRQQSNATRSVSLMHQQNNKENAMTGSGKKRSHHVSQPPQNAEGGVSMQLPSFGSFVAAPPGYAVDPQYSMELF